MYNLNKNSNPKRQATDSSANAVRFDNDSSTYEGSEIQTLYVDPYAGEISNLLGGVTVTGRLLLKSATDELKGFMGKSWYNNSVKTSFWSGSALDGDTVWFLGSTNGWGDDWYDRSDSFGVRPVISFDKSLL